MEPEHFVDRADLDLSLIDAAEKGDVEKVGLLLQAGAAVNAKNDKALRRAAQYGHTKVVRLLLKAGAKADAKNSLALRQAALYGHTKIGHLLLQAGANVDAENHQALILAAGNGNEEFVQLLLEAGADVHAERDQALSLAVEYGREKTVRALLRAGADVCVMDDEIFRRVDYSSHSKEIVQMLLKTGACSHRFTSREMEKPLTPCFILSSGENLVAQIEESHPDLGEKYRWSEGKRALKSVREEKAFDARIVLADLCYRPGESAYYRAITFVKG